MKTIAIASVLIGALGLSACNPSQILSYEEAVAADARALCGVDAIFSTIAPLFGLETEAAAAAAICAAIPKGAVARASDGHRVPKPVLVDGFWIAFK